VVTLPAHLVATPVLECLTQRFEGQDPAGGVAGVVLGAGATAAWVDVGGFVIAITSREVPLLPNAIALSAGSGALPHRGVTPGATARLTPGVLTLGPLRITWDPTTPPRWDPTVPVPSGLTPDVVATRGAAILRALRSRSALHPEEAELLVEEGVDSRENTTPRSATLPLRGPQQPGGVEPGALRGPGAGASAGAGAGTSAGAGAGATAGTDAGATAGTGAGADAGAGAGGLAWAALQPGGADPSTLVRELARVGLVTAADPEGADGLTLLFRAVRDRDPEPAAAAARALLGRGPGLTPEGDDLLAAVAGTLAVLGPAISRLEPARQPSPRGPTRNRQPHPPAHDPLLDALAPTHGRTTALSATLLALASRRRLPEPAGRLLNFDPAAGGNWLAALGRLDRLGHGSGRAYAAGIGAAAVLLADGARVG
jgi:Protein of unknown function (DUF2877)